MKTGWKIASILCALTAVLALYVWSSGRQARPAIGEERVLALADHRVQYYLHGRGETVVLLASLGRSASDFNELAGTLAGAGFRTVAVELRGIGGSTGSGLFKKLTQHDYAADVAAVIRGLGGPDGGRVHVIGHAYGNRIARTLAADSPELVKSVTLIAAGGYVPIPGEIRKAMYLIFFNFLPDRVRERCIREAFFAPGNAIPEHWVRGWYFRASWPQSRATLRTPREQWWSGGTAPILLLQGENDRIAPEENARIMKKEFGDRVKVVSIPRAGHAMLPEQGELIEKAIVPFLERRR
ncbi:MAG: alpha/beta hydrolase [Spirochaetes bacterium]|nr:alpha/beta hydrolase [Spirochaetota bacterium]